ncbi:MAG: N-acetylglucosamine-6-phosphate deacetylase [Candidatus Omnitrophica bacterium]|nr:N-acetylglucosamine-6-phosphate deacetylase [Candidatus Omnitrophota bacterium]
MRIARGRIVGIRSSAPKGARTISARGCYVAPGFIDLHVWGSPGTVSREAVKGGTSAFLTTLGPETPQRLLSSVEARARAVGLPGAECLGFHLEGPFLNPDRSGALSQRWMRRPTLREIRALAHAARGRLRLITLAPELPAATAAIRWCAKHRIAVSLGHSDADTVAAARAVVAGARAVTHVFNGMRPFHHRSPGLLDVALIDPRLVAMVICDGVHVSPSAFRLLVQAKGADRIALVTDSIRFQGWDVMKRQGAYWTKQGVLAGSVLTMIEAVRNAVRVGGVSLEEAVRMASEIPARLIGDRSRGALAVGQRADLVTFDRHFRVHFTVVGGNVVYQRGT